MEEHAEEKASKVKVTSDESSSIIRVPQIKFSYTWTIYNFSFSIDNGHHSAFSSPMFASGCSNELKWDMNLYPMSRNEEDKEFVTLNIYFYDHDDFDEVLAECEVAIINDKGEEAYIVKTNSVHNFTANDSQWDKADFIKRDYLMDKTNGLLIDDKLTLVCRINASGYYESSNEDKNIKYQVSRNRLKISEDLVLLLDKKCYDVVFLLHGQEFHLHKPILAARSRVFSAMFEHEMQEQTNNTVVITDISCEALNHLIQYIYSGTIKNIDKLSKEILTELLVAADKYELNDLKEMCEVIFYHKLTISNAIETLLFADFHNAEKLKDQVIVFIVAHNREFIDDPAFESLSNSHSHLLPKFIELNLNINFDSLNDLFYSNLIDNFTAPIMSTPVEGKCWGVSQIKVDECNYTWKINNFSFFLKTESTEEKILSQKFTKNENDFSWQLILYPRGLNKEAKDYISLFIQLFTTKDKIVDIRAQYEFFLLNNENKKIINTKSDILIFIPNGEKLGEATFLKKDYLLDNVNELLSNDVLTIMCKVTSSFSYCKTISQREPMNFCLPKYQLGVSLDHERLLEDGKFSDIVLIASGKEFRIHQVILSARCPSFLARINQHLKKEKESTVEISDIEPDVLKELLLFIYSGKVENLKRMAKRLYSEANNYELESLKFICETYLCKTLNINNVCDNFVFAHLNKACKLKAEAARFIAENLHVIVSTLGYKCLATSRPQLLKDIICKLHS